MWWCLVLHIAEFNPKPVIFMCMQVSWLSSIPFARIINALHARPCLARLTRFMFVQLSCCDGITSKQARSYFRRHLTPTQPLPTCMQLLVAVIAAAFVFFHWLVLSLWHKLPRQRKGRHKGCLQPLPQILVFPRWGCTYIVRLMDVPSSGQKYDSASEDTPRDLHAEW